MTEDKIMEVIRWADEKHYVMSGGVSTEVDGLHSSHAYTIIGISDLTDSQGQPMIKIRNPHSNERYYGEGSDQDSDGVFSMPIESFRAAFKYIDVLFYDDWKWTSTGVQEWSGNHEVTYYNFNVTEAQDVVFVFETPAERQMEACD